MKETYYGGREQTDHLRVVKPNKKSNDTSRKQMILFFPFFSERSALIWGPSIKWENPSNDGVVET